MNLSTSYLNLSAPNVPVFIVSFVVVVVAVLMQLNVIPSYDVTPIWVAIVGYVVLFLGNLLSGL